MNNLWLDEEVRAAYEALELAEIKLVNAGYSIFRCISRYEDSGVEFHTRIGPGDSILLQEGEVSFDHTFADAIRELSVEWSNSVHDHQIVQAGGDRPLVV